MGTQLLFFVIKELGVPIAYDVYDIAANDGIIQSGARLTRPGVDPIQRPWLE